MASAASTGSAYQLIMDHVLTYPGTYELPLRTMYALNCAPRTQQPSSGSRRPASPGSAGFTSPANSQGSFQHPETTLSFTENLMAQMSQISGQPSSLPPSFITSFLLRCFPPDLVCVDFPQALTGLDYLKDLETRRRRDVATALGRMGVDRSTLDGDAAPLIHRSADVKQWVDSILDKERRVDALYTQLFIALRRWILINELSLAPFNKHNCVAMLNTLYPPVISTQPTSKLTFAVLKSQRDSFFKYVIAVERQGPRVLSNLMHQGQGAGEENGWASVTRTLGAYLQLANSIINECINIVEAPDSASQQGSKRSSARSNRSKFDSGVSFHTTPANPERPSTGSSTSSDHLPQSPLEGPSGTVKSRFSSHQKSGASSALEKLARGLRTIGRSRTDATEMLDNFVPTTTTPQLPPVSPERKGLRKMKSMGAIERGTGSRKATFASLGSPPASAMPSFDVELMKKERARYDAGLSSPGLPPAPTRYGASHEV